MLGSLSWSPWNAVFPVHWLDDEADMREAVAPLFTLQIEPTEQELRGDRPRRVGREGVRRAAIDEAPVAGARAVRRAAHSSNALRAVKPSFSSVRTRSPGPGRACGSLPGLRANDRRELPWPCSPSPDESRRRGLNRAIPCGVKRKRHRFECRARMNTGIAKLDSVAS